MSITLGHLSQMKATMSAVLAQYLFGYFVNNIAMPAGSCETVCLFFNNLASTLETWGKGNLPDILFPKVPVAVILPVLFRRKRLQFDTRDHFEARSREHESEFPRQSFKRVAIIEIRDQCFERTAKNTAASRCA